MNLLRAMMIVGLAVLWGCGDDGHDHDHNHDHPHGAEDDHDHGEEGHVHKPSYGGMLVPLGEEFANVEVKLDGGSGELTAWVWDGCAEDPIRISQTELVIDIGSGEDALTVSLGGVADPLTGEKIGDTCQFSGRDDALKGLDHFAGTLRSIEVKGQRLEGVKFEYKPGN